MDRSTKITPWIWVSAWAVLVAVAVYFRPILPVDETRYVSVAWEMWFGENFMVPHLNGKPYSHKPPLLFWLIQAGWQVFGVNEWWPRLVAPFFGLGCLFLTALLGRRLWPDTDAYLVAPFLMLGSLFWGLYTTLTMFDLLLCFWTLVGLIGVTDVWTAQPLRGWVLFAVGIGFGVLSKGPVILIFLLPTALLAPLWVVGRSVSWRSWYVGLFCSVTTGVVLALLWAVPAGLLGGAEYRDAIFWGQSAGRVINAFDHGKPAWWYLPLLPVILLPWLLWPSLLVATWRGLRGSIAPLRNDAGVRLTLVWIIAALVVLSAVSGKRLHYLLPIIPAASLIGAAFIATVVSGRLIGRKWDLLPVSILAFLIAGLVGSAGLIGETIGRTEWTQGIHAAWSIPLFAAAVLLVVRPPLRTNSRALAIGAVGILIVVTLHGIAAPRLETAYDVRPLAAHLAGLQKQGYKIANYGKYHGQYNFLGRLTETIGETGDGDITAWLQKNPKSKIVSHHYVLPEGAKPDFVVPFRGRLVAVWDAATISANPELARRK